MNSYSRNKKKAEQEGRYIEWYRVYIAYIVLIMQMVSIALIKKNPSWDYYFEGRGEVRLEEIECKISSNYHKGKAIDNERMIKLKSSVSFSI